MAEINLLGKCGLYCGICTDYTDCECEGCGCTSPNTAAAWHNTHCEIALCVASRGHESCADCDELACTKLIHFAYDPIWRSHLPVIENCRRIRRIGTEAWLNEQRAYFENDRNRRVWQRLHRQCGKELQRFRAESEE